MVCDAAGPAAGASGAPAGLLTPRLERADRPHVRATLAAFDFARRTYAGMEGFHPGGVRRLARDAHERARLSAIAAMMDQRVEWDGEALHMHDAARIEPVRLVAAMLGDVPVQRTEVHAVETTGEATVLRDRDGREILRADLVVHAAGAGTARWYPDISPSAGQIAVFAGAAPEPPVSWGGYACAAPGGVLVGATHVKGEAGLSDAEAVRGFRAALADRLPGVEAGDVVSTWQGVRASTPDRLPVAGAAGPGGFILSGLGSRGFAHAPLLAEHVASLALGQAVPLEAAGAEALDPARFEARRRRRGG